MHSRSPGAHVLAGAALGLTRDAPRISPGAHGSPGAHAMQPRITRISGKLMRFLGPREPLPPQTRPQIIFRAIFLLYKAHAQMTHASPAGATGLPGPHASPYLLGAHGIFPGASRGDFGVLVSFLGAHVSGPRGTPTRRA